MKRQAALVLKVPTHLKNASPFISLKISDKKESADRRSFRRFDVCCQGELELAGETLKLFVRNVSLRGISATTGDRKKVPFGTKLSASILSDKGGKECRLTLSAVWSDDEGVFGFKVENADNNWADFIHSLEADG